MSPSGLLWKMMLRMWWMMMWRKLWMMWSFRPARHLPGRHLFRGEGWLSQLWHPLRGSSKHTGDPPGRHRLHGEGSTEPCRMLLDGSGNRLGFGLLARHPPGRYPFRGESKSRPLWLLRGHTGHSPGRDRLHGEGWSRPCKRQRNRWQEAIRHWADEQVERAKMDGRQMDGRQAVVAVLQ